MHTLEINLPDFVDMDTSELKLLLASKLYESRKLSLGQAAELASVSKRTLMELMGKYDVSVFNFESKDVEQDLLNA